MKHLCSFRTLTPLSASVFKMHFNSIDQVHDNLRNLILTNNGDRLGRYNFGANLQPILTEKLSKESFDERYY